MQTTGKVIQNHENENVCNIGQGKPDAENTGDLNLVVVMCMTVQVSKLPW
jgi:hypothetical protein